MIDVSSPAGSRLRIGIDFDNTIIRYDRVFLGVAKDRGLVGSGFRGDKRAVRDALRALPDGDRLWQRLQGHVYGKGIGAAELFEGVDGFLQRCRRERCTVLIVSHKTQTGHYDPDRIDLRQAALGWMTERSFFAQDHYDIPVENVYWEATRADKLRRIRALGCTHFIDDLEEVLGDPAFPAGIARLLLAAGRPARSSPLYSACPSWRHIERHVFADVS